MELAAPAVFIGALRVFVWYYGMQILPIEMEGTPC